MTSSEATRALVTGGAGFIGSNLVDLLLEQGHHVVVIDDFSSGSYKNLAHHAENPRLSVRELDIRQYDRLLSAMAGASVVFHLAVQCLRLSLSDPALVHEVNARGTLNVALAAQACEVDRLVYVSSSEVYGTAVEAQMDEEHPLEPTTVYGASKLAGELYCKAIHHTDGLSTVIVRPFNNFGPRSHADGVYGEVIPRFMAAAMLGKQPMIFGDGGQSRDFIYVKDTVRGIVLAAQSDALVGDVVNIARGRPVTIRDLSDRILGRYGTPGLEPVTGPERPGDVRHHHADTSKAHRLLQFRAGVSLNDGLDLYHDWLRQHPEEVENTSQKLGQINWQE